MEEIRDFIAENLADQSDLDQGDSQHWLDAHFPFKNSGGDDDMSGIEILERPGVNGSAAANTDEG